LILNHKNIKQSSALIQTVRKLIFHNLSLNVSYINMIITTIHSVNVKFGPGHGVLIQL